MGWVCVGCGATDEYLCEGYEMCDKARACLDCDNVYDGGVKCPVCGGVGEPLDLDDTYNESKEVENVY